MAIPGDETELIIEPASLSESLSQKQIEDWGISLAKPLKSLMDQALAQSIPPKQIWAAMLEVLRQKVLDTPLSDRARVELYMMMVQLSIPLQKGLIEAVQEFSDDGCFTDKLGNFLQEKLELNVENWALQYATSFINEIPELRAACVKSKT